MTEAMVLAVILGLASPARADDDFDYGVAAGFTIIGDPLVVYGGPGDVHPRVHGSKGWLGPGEITFDARIDDHWWITCRGLAGYGVDDYASTAAPDRYLDKVKAGRSVAVALGARLGLRYLIPTRAVDVSPFAELGVDYAYTEADVTRITDSEVSPPPTSQELDISETTALVGNLGIDFDRWLTDGLALRLRVEAFRLGWGKASDVQRLPDTPDREITDRFLRTDFGLSAFLDFYFGF